jgi:poly(3-hydroxybutyrate) depolymerase
MLYHAYELAHAALAPMKALCRFQQALTDNGFNPWLATPQGRVTDAACRWFDGVTQRYDRPDWNITDAPPGSSFGEDVLRFGALRLQWT